MKHSLQQDQFLNVVSRDEAETRFRDALCLDPLDCETVPLNEALGRILAEDVSSSVDVPSFDRSNLDGFAVRAEDTFGAVEEVPKRLRLLDEIIHTAMVPNMEVQPGQAMSIATGGMLPRGADAIVMVENADIEGDQVTVRKAVTEGLGITFAGTDIANGETVMRIGQTLTSREMGVLAAIGAAKIRVWKKPRVAIISTGDEIIDPGADMKPGLVFDSNARILADAVTELGGHPIEMGIVRDDPQQLRNIINCALQTCDVLLLSGGTSKGAGDLSYRVVREYQDPGIVAHGVALKPGKPICLAVEQGKPLVILPGFPTSAIFTFHEFVAPVIRALAGRAPEGRQIVPARMALKFNSEVGRTEYLLVGLVESASPQSSADKWIAYPMGKGSGSVTTFSGADGFVTVDRHQEQVAAGSRVQVQLLGHGLRLAEFVAIGSHCVGLDWLIGQLQREGYQTKFLAVGSNAGLEAARRGECDVAGIHLLDSRTDQYNAPFVGNDLNLVSGYGRRQGIVFRPDDDRFVNTDVPEIVEQALSDQSIRMINRNAGSGTRVLIDQLLLGVTPAGYAIQPSSHNAVVAAVKQGRADWGVAIETVAVKSGLAFRPVRDEQFDFAIPKTRMERPAVKAFCQLIGDVKIRQQLKNLGFSV